MNDTTLNKLNPKQVARSSVNDLDPYIPGRPINAIKDEFRLDKVVKLASNESSVKMPEGVCRAIVDAIEDVGRYPDGHARELRRALSEDLDIPFETTLIGNGAEDCINMIGQAFLNPGDESVIPEPTFDAYRVATEFMEATPVYVPLKDDCIDLDKVLGAATDKTKIVWICSPNNPTGTVLKRDAFDTFLDKLPNNIVVVLDQAYWEYITSENPANACDYLDTDARVIGIRTFSKVFGLAGLRIGYLTAHPSIVKVIAKVKPPFNVNVLAQAAALAALKEKTFKAQHLETTQVEREKMIAAFKARGITVKPSETNFLMVPLPFSGDDLFNRLLSQGVIVRPGSVFKIPNAIRLSIGNPEENRFFLEKFDRAMLEMMGEQNNKTITV
jgi:histidinol-phosphate aminotransferase